MKLVCEEQMLGVFTIWLAIFKNGVLIGIRQVRAGLFVVGRIQLVAGVVHMIVLMFMASLRQAQIRQRVSESLFNLKLIELIMLVPRER